MFHSILVPLDGTGPAEQALAPAAALAARSAASLSFAVVHPWGQADDAPISGTMPDREFRDAEGVYLNRLAQQVASAYGIPIREAILEGPTGPALVEFAREHHVDLVVATTHSRGALGRFVLGSVTHHLVHQLRVSVLLIQPREALIEMIPFNGFERILLATDGSARVEAAFEPTVALASDSAVITLFQVVMPAARGRQVLDQRRAEAERQLTALVPRLTTHGLGAGTMVTIAANPASAILVQAERSDADLIALTTRDRGTVERALFGSVADAVIHRASVPVLVCHAGGSSRSPS